MFVLANGCPAESPCSPIALAQGSSEDAVFVADAGRNAVLGIVLSTGEVKSQFPLRGSPSGLVGTKTKPWLLVTLGIPKGEVLGLDAATGKELFSFPVGHTPCSPLLSNDEATLYVCNRFDNAVAAYDLTSLREKWKTPVLREPVAAALTPDGSKLVVANLLPDGVATERPFSADVSILDAATGRLLANVPLPNGSTGLQGVAASPDGRFAYVTHTLGRYQSPTKQVDFGWMNVNAFTVIDLKLLKTVATIPLDDLEEGAANPWGIACSADQIVVAHAGSREISIIDRDALHEKLDRLAKGEAVSKISTELACVQNDLEFLQGIRSRIPVVGEGPRFVILSGGNVIVGEYFSGKLAVVDLVSPHRVCEVKLSDSPPPDPVRRGEILFSSAAMCRQKWQSCASCHPDARVDGFNWDLLNDGTGNPKNVQSMLNAHRTPPAMWTGIRETAESAVRAGFRHIQFAEISEVDAQAVDAYLKSLIPVPGPVSCDPSLRDSIARGKSTFQSVKCSNCHSGDYFTDGKAHDVGTGRGLDADKPFVTPALIECWRTAPYFHDGRAATISDVLQSHGNVDDLSTEEQRDLVNYLVSL
jgi:DNA-binding beta-propeller fold protein YncE/mono/diheme cytochrome c family protein